MHKEPFGYRVAHHGYPLMSCPGHLLTSIDQRKSFTKYNFRFFVKVKKKIDNFVRLNFTVALVKIYDSSNLLVDSFSKCVPGFYKF